MPRAPVNSERRRQPSFRAARASGRLPAGRILPPVQQADSTAGGDVVAGGGGGVGASLSGTALIGGRCDRRPTGAFVGAVHPAQNHLLSVQAQVRAEAVAQGELDKTGRLMHSVPPKSAAPRDSSPRRAPLQRLSGGHVPLGRDAPPLVAQKRLGPRSNHSNHTNHFNHSNHTTTATTTAAAAVHSNHSDHASNNVNDVNGDSAGDRDGSRGEEKRREMDEGQTRSPKGMRRRISDTSAKDDGAGDGIGAFDGAVSVDGDESANDNRGKIGVETGGGEGIDLRVESQGPDARIAQLERENRELRRRLAEAERVMSADATNNNHNGISASFQTQPVSKRESSRVVRRSSAHATAGTTTATMTPPPESNDEMDTGSQGSRDRPNLIDKFYSNGGVHSARANGAAPVADDRRGTAAATTNSVARLPTIDSTAGLLQGSFGPPRPRPMSPNSDDGFAAMFADQDDTDDEERPRGVGKVSRSESGSRFTLRRGSSNLASERWQATQRRTLFLVRTMKSVIRDDRTSLSASELASFTSLAVSSRLSQPEELTGAELTSYDGVAAFFDTSGFTALSERLAKRFGRGSAEKLCTVMNGFLGQVVRKVAEWGGDIIKFAGDAVLVVWSSKAFAVGDRDAVLKRAAEVLGDDDGGDDGSGGERDNDQNGKSQSGADDASEPSVSVDGKAPTTGSTAGIAAEEDEKREEAMRLCARVACACALETTRILHGYDSTEGAALSLHTGIASGRIHSLFIGGVYERWEHLVEGSPLRILGDAVEVARRGEVVVSESVRDLLADPERCTVQAEGVTKRPDAAVAGTGADQGGYGTTVSGLYRLVAPEGVFASSWPERRLARTLAADFVRISRVNPDVLCHGKLTISKLKSRLSRFVPAAVKASLAQGNGLSTSVMRQATVVFVQFFGLAREPTPSGDRPHLAQWHALMTSLQRITYRYEGSLNKFLVDDKGVIAVLVFGLPPLPHEDDPVRGCVASLCLVSAASAAGLLCKVGVTTGRVFAGTVGSTGRREYTVMGSVVNTAARLMNASAPEAVTVDESTYLDALHEVHFSRVGSVRVKGIEGQVAAYRCVRRLHTLRRVDPELTGRDDECEVLESAVTRMLARWRTPGQVAAGLRKSLSGAQLAPKLTGEVTVGSEEGGGGRGDGDCGDNENMDDEGASTWRSRVRRDTSTYGHDADDANPNDNDDDNTSVRPDDDDDDDDGHGGDIANSDAGVGTGGGRNRSAANLTAGKTSGSLNGTDGRARSSSSGLAIGRNGSGGNNNLDRRMTNDGYGGAGRDGDGDDSAAASKSSSWHATDAAKRTALPAGGVSSVRIQGERKGSLVASSIGDVPRGGVPDQDPAPSFFGSGRSSFESTPSVVTTTTAAPHNTSHAAAPTARSGSGPMLSTVPGSSINSQSTLVQTPDGAAFSPAEMAVDDQQRPEDDQMRVIIIEGPRGIGKTRLLRALLRIAEKRGVPHLSAEGDPSNTSNTLFQSAPYAALSGLIGTMFGLPNRVAELPMQVESYTRPGEPPITPLLNDCIQGLRLEENSHTARMSKGERSEWLKVLLSRVFRSVRLPCVLSVDTAQSLDPASWALVAKCASMGFLVCLAVQPMAHSPVEFTQLKTAKGTMLMHPGPLSREACDAISSYYLSPPTMLEAPSDGSKSGDASDAEPEPLPPPPRAVLDKLWAWSEGNPKFIDEGVMYLFSRSIVSVAPGGLTVDHEGLCHAHVPGPIDAEVTAHLEKLRPRLRVVLKVAAVLPEKFSLLRLSKAVHTMGRRHVAAASELLVRMNMFDLVSTNGWTDEGGAPIDGGDVDEHTPTEITRLREKRRESVQGEDDGETEGHADQETEDQQQQHQQQRTEQQQEEEEEEVEEQEDEIDNADGEGSDSVSPLMPGRKGSVPDPAPHQPHVQSLKRTSAAAAAQAQRRGSIHDTSSPGAGAPKVTRSYSINGNEVEDDDGNLGFTHLGEVMAPKDVILSFSSPLLREVLLEHMLLKDRNVLERTAILSEISTSEESMSSFVRDVVLHEVGDRDDRIKKELGTIDEHAEAKLVANVKVTQYVHRPLVRGGSKLRNATKKKTDGSDTDR